MNARLIAGTSPALRCQLGQERRLPGIEQGWPVPMTEIGLVVRMYLAWRRPASSRLPVAKALDGALIVIVSLAVTSAVTANANHTIDISLYYRTNNIKRAVGRPKSASPAVPPLPHRADVVTDHQLATTRCMVDSRESVILDTSHSHVQEGTLGKLLSFRRRLLVVANKHRERCGHHE